MAVNDYQNNTVVASTMLTNEMEVEIHDLYSFAKTNAAKIQKKADVHYTRAGSIQLAEEVVKTLKIQ